MYSVPCATICSGTPSTPAKQVVKKKGMIFEIKIQYQEGVARYQVHMDAYRIYTARLIQFTGARATEPPSFVLLVKALHTWVGTQDNTELVHAIGIAIDQVWSEVKKVRLITQETSSTIL